MTTTPLPRNLTAVTAMLIAVLPTLPAQADDGHFRFLEPLRKELFATPWARLATLERVLEAPAGVDSGFTLVTEEDLVAALTKHVGPEDTPAFREDQIRGMAFNVLDALAYMDEGYDIYQYDVNWTPRWLVEMRGEHYPEAPEGWLSLKSVMALKNVSERTAKEYCAHHLTSHKCFGGEYYVNPDETFDRWLASIPDYGALVRRLEVLDHVFALNAALGDSKSLDECYRLAEAHERYPRGISGYYERYPIEKFVARHLGSETQWEGRHIDDRTAAVLPATLADWRRDLPAMLDWARDERETQLRGLV